MLDDSVDPDDPSVRSKAYGIMRPRWDKINTVLAGTEAMREAGEVYTPKHQEETDLAYKDRLAGTTLLNMLERTLDDLVGKPFSDEVSIDEVAKGLLPWMDDVDLQGNNVGVFCRNWFHEGWAKAFCHVLVEFPTKPPEVVTVADEKAANLRPYLVLIKPECVIDARSEWINGKEVLTHIRVMETYQVVNGFSTEEKRRIRVLEPGTVQIFIPKKVKGKMRWVQDGPTLSTGLDFIPWVTFYSSPRQELMVAKPRLLDLADLNITHWQSTSDQRHILTVARFPILACSGATSDDDEDKSIVIGPNRILYNKDPQGKFYYVEHDGKAIEAGRQDLVDLETKMASYGGEFLKTKPGTQTATEKSINTAEATSVLKSTVEAFVDAVSVALSYMAKWSKQGDDGGKIGICTDWSGTDPNRAANLQTLKDCRARREISRKAYLDILKEYGILEEDFDPVEDAELIKNEPLFLTPQEITALEGVAAGQHISKTEIRALLRRAGIASQTDDAAAAEIENTLEYGPGRAATGLPNNKVLPEEDEEETEEKTEETKKEPPPQE